jgi:hypothetical protein
MDDISRFRSKVSKNGPVPEHRPELGPCWPWTGDCDDSGYGLFYFHDENGKLKRTRAHRWLLGYLRGKPLLLKPVGIEDGCHHCDYRPCCNPDHLYVGTRKRNVADAVERQRLRQQKVTHCPKCGTEYTYNPSGRHRRCKVCERAAQRKTRTLDRERCKYGHLLAGDNVLLCKNGTRKCRTCDEARLAASIATRRRKAAAKAA